MYPRWASGRSSRTAQCSAPLACSSWCAFAAAASRLSPPCTAPLSAHCPPALYIYRVLIPLARCAHCCIVWPQPQTMCDLYEVVCESCYSGAEIKAAGTHTQRRVFGRPKRRKRACSPLTCCWVLSLSIAALGYASFFFVVFKPGGRAEVPSVPFGDDSGKVTVPENVAWGYGWGAFFFQPFWGFFREVSDGGKQMWAQLVGSVVLLSDPEVLPHFDNEHTCAHFSTSAWRARGTHDGCCNAPIWLPALVWSRTSLVRNEFTQCACQTGAGIHQRQSTFALDFRQPSWS